MARTQDWLPAKGQWFNAYHKGHLHPAGPFKCCEVKFEGSYADHVDAEGADGDGWHFAVSKFRFAARNKN